MVIDIRMNLFDLVKQLERKKGAAVTHTEIADRSGLSRYTIQKLINNETGRVDFDTLKALLNFFDNEGMTIGVDDLFVVQRD